jgi:cytochrome c oxidase cbb3-type subunit III
MRFESGLMVATFAIFTIVAAHLAVNGTPLSASPTRGPQQTSAPQDPPGGAGAQGRGRGAGRGSYPAQQRPPGDPAIIARGKGLYDINCRSCHGPDLRGGDLGGPNLLRSQLVLNDQDGELILPVVQSGRQSAGMPPMPPLNLPADDVKAIATFVHSVLAAMGRQGRPPEGPPVELNILVGDAAAGQAYFAAKCAACHSPTGDLKGIAARIADPKTLQNLWVSGGGGGGRGGGGEAPAPSRARPTTVTVTFPSGERIEGRLLRWDDFAVTLIGADGSPRSVRRDGDVPKVEIHDPLEPHKKLLPLYRDKDIHDVTAYLVTLK